MPRLPRASGIQKRGCEENTHCWVLAFRVSKMIFGFQLELLDVWRVSWLTLLLHKPGCWQCAIISQGTVLGDLTNHIIAAGLYSAPWQVQEGQADFPLERDISHSGQSPRPSSYQLLFKTLQNSAEIFILHRQLLSFPSISILASCYCCDSMMVCFREFMILITLITCIII